jgi:hypothetical protein
MLAPAKIGTKCLGQSLCTPFCFGFTLLVFHCITR